MNRRLLATSASLTLGVLLLAGCGGGGAEAGGTTAAPSASASSSAAGDPQDVAFAQMMIPHHEQAVEMADLALERATTPEVRELATQVKGAQDPEIATMRGWLEEWGAPQTMPGTDGTEGMDHSTMGHDMGGMGDMGGTGEGMMTGEQMDALASASGAAFDRMWLTMMIAHHEGAVVMARSVLGTTQDAEVTELAEAIVAGQEDEITTMQGLLAP